MLFSELPESAFEHLLLPITNIKYPGGCALYEEGGNDEAVYSIRNGLVKLQHLAPDGLQRIVRLLGFGSALGLELLDGGEGYRHSAVTLGNTDVCRIPLATLRKLEKEFPNLCHQIRLRLQDDLDKADRLPIHGIWRRVYRKLVFSLGSAQR
jgi:CRP-like cAMP-binding protein